jgi:hypothetical protein
MYKSITLPVILYGCKTWFFILREEHTLKVSQNEEESRRIYGPKREKHNGRMENIA